MALDGIVLEVAGVSKSFGALAALTNVSLSVRRGEVFSVIGPNGAGNCPLFNVVSGLYAPTAGRVSFLGREITGLAPETINRLGVAKTFQITNIFPEISVGENVRVAAQSRASVSGRLASLWRRADVETRVAELLDAFGLTAKRDELAENLSHGEQRYLEICLALATEPTLLLLDEPVAGMTRAEKEKTVALMESIVQRSTCTIMLIEHDMQFVRQIAGRGHRVTVLHEGSVLSEGSIDRVQSDERVIEAYLGRGTVSAEAPC